MRAIAHHHNILQPIRARNHRQPLRRFLGVVALRLRNDRLFRHAVRQQIIVSHAALGVPIRGIAPSQSDNHRRQSPLIQFQRMIEPRPQHRGRTTVIFRSAKHRNRICGPRLIAMRVVPNLPIHPQHPRQRPRDHDPCDPKHHPSPRGRCPAQPCPAHRPQIVLRYDHRSCSASAIACVGIAPSRKICHVPSGPDKSTMVVGTLRPVGPPSTISGILSPSWSRTHAA